MRSVFIRIFAWTSLLSCGAACIAAGILAGQSDSLNRFVLHASEPGPMANWAFFFLTFGVAISVYIIHGVEGGGWMMQMTHVVIVSVIAVLLLLFGMRALFIMAMLGSPAYAIRSFQRGGPRQP